MDKAEHIMRDCVVFGGRTHPDLVKRICETLAIEPTKIDTKNFSNGETSIKIHESVRDKDVFVVQTATPNVNDSLMELLIIVSALKISSAKRVTVVLPLFPYSRQLSAGAAQAKARKFAAAKLEENESLVEEEDVEEEEEKVGRHARFKITNKLGQVVHSPRKVNFGEEPTLIEQIKNNEVEASIEVSQCLRLVNNVPEGSKRNSFGMATNTKPLPMNAWVSQNGSLVASLLATAGADHVITMDLHDPQFQGFFDVPFDNLLFRPLLLEYIQTMIPNYHSAVIVSPDAGGAQRATAVADQLRNRFALIHQDRRNNATILVGDVNDRVAILVDDLLDSGKTILRAGRILKDHGAVKVYAICTHGLFSNNTAKKFTHSAIDQIVVTNSVPQDQNQAVLKDKLHVVDTSLLFAEAIRRVYNGESFSRLYTQPPMAL